MLTYTLLNNHAGILLTGDYITMETLNEVVREVNEESPIILDKEGTFLALAYDARKAYQGDRQVINPPQHFKRIGVRYGVEILWPILLVQSRMLRVSLSYFDSTKRQQAITYSLESVIEAALQDDFGEIASMLVEQWNRIDPAHPWAEEKLDSRGAQFSIWTREERETGISGLLASLDPMYLTLYQIWINQGVKYLVSPEEFECAEWMDPNW